MMYEHNAKIESELKHVRARQYTYLQLHKSKLSIKSEILVIMQILLMNGASMSINKAKSK